LQIGSKPSEKVYQGKESPDTYLVVDTVECVVTLYATVDTMLRPTFDTFLLYQDRPHFWSENTGMMSILSEVSSRSFENIDGQFEAEGILQLMEAELQKI
jgi:hypothetical protein